MPHSSLYNWLHNASSVVIILYFDIIWLHHAQHMVAQCVYCILLIHKFTCALLYMFNLHRGRWLVPYLLAIQIYKHIAHRHHLPSAWPSASYGRLTNIHKSGVECRLFSPEQTKTKAGTWDTAYLQGKDFRLCTTQLLRFWLRTPALPTQQSGVLHSPGSRIWTWWSTLSARSTSLHSCNAHQYQ